MQTPTAIASILRGMADEYRVQLDVFSGPLDLLLYLIQRDELDIFDIPIARITEQYLEYLHLLEHLDPNAAGEFLVMASTLVELKSRALLPTPPLDAPDEIEDPRTSLVRQLLEYKRFKDAARALGSAADERARRFVRRPADLPDELRGVELEEVEIWDLLSAFNRVMTAIGRGPGHHAVSVDDRPIEHYESLIVESLERDGPRAFAALFQDCGARAEIVGTFLALLELIRRRRVRAEQEKLFGEIYLFLLVEPAEAEPVGPEPAERAAPSPADDEPATAS
jgi:segregation and condensation protein A